MLWAFRVRVPTRRPFLIPFPSLCPTLFPVHLPSYRNKGIKHQKKGMYSKLQIYKVSMPFQTYPLALFLSLCFVINHVFTLCGSSIQCPRLTRVHPKARRTFKHSVIGNSKSSQTSTEPSSSKATIPHFLKSID